MSDSNLIYKKAQKDMNKFCTNIMNEATINKPVRVQRTRKKGGGMISPNGLPVVYVGRPTKYGNPHKVGDSHPHHKLSMSHEEACQEFRYVLRDGGYLSKQDIDDLRGKNLACWCSHENACHADILLEIANEGALDGGS